MSSGAPYGPNSLCGITGAPSFCDGFETGNYGAFWQAIDLNSTPGISISKTLSAWGNDSIRFAGKTSAFLNGDISRTVQGGAYYGRTYIYFNMTAFPAIQHVELIMNYPSNFQGYVPRVSLLYESATVAYWGVGMVGGNSDWILPDNHDTYVSTAKPIPLKKWICVEWMFNATTNGMDLWTDGVAHPSLHVTQSTLTNPPADFAYLKNNSGNPQGSKIGDMTNLRIGLPNSNTTVDLLMDEIAVSGTRIGCGTP